LYFGVSNYDYGSVTSVYADNVSLEICPLIGPLKIGVARIG